MFDVIVVGLGGVGSAAACHLAQRGLSVLGLEKYSPVHHYGASHGGTRIMRHLQYEDPAYVPLARRASELWERVEHDAGTRIFSAIGGLMVGPENGPLIAGAAKSAAEWDLPCELLDAADTRRRFPTLNPEPGMVAVYDAGAGVVHPEAAVAAHHMLAERAGAQLRFREPVLDWAARGDGVRVRTASAVYTASRLVLCPGAWAKYLIHVGMELNVETIVQCWFRPRDGAAEFDYAKHPSVIWECDNGVMFLCCPDMRDGQGVKIGFSLGTQAEVPDNRIARAADIQQIRRYLRNCMPSVAGVVRRHATCVDGTTADQHFVVAPHPDHPNVIVGCGFSGHGFKFVPVLGEILADLASAGTTTHPIDLFDPRRPRTLRIGHELPKG